MLHFAMRSIVRKLMLPADAVLGLAPAGVAPLVVAGPPQPLLPPRARLGLICTSAPSRSCLRPAICACWQPWRQAVRRRAGLEPDG